MEWAMSNLSQSRLPALRVRPVGRGRPAPDPHGCLLFVVLLLLGTSSLCAQDARPVEVVSPEQVASVQRVELTGSFNARRQALLSPRISGLVASVEVDAGDPVSAGDVLLRLDDRLAELERAQVDAAVNEARAVRDEALRLRDEGRRLVRDRFVPETQVLSRESELQVAEAALAVAGARRDAVRERVERHRIVAPFDGVITRKLSEAGEWVETGAAVVELVAVDDLWLDLRAPQRLWPEIGSDIQAEVVVDALPDQQFEASVHARVPVSDPAARTFLLRLVLDSPSESITPGMSARARIELRSGLQAVLIPRDAVIRYPDGTTTVWVVDRQTTPPRVNEFEIDIARTRGDQVEIVSGLNASQSVVVRGNEVLSEDDPVRIVER